MQPNTTTGKCEFQAKKSSYSALTPGDMKRCWLDSDPANKDKAMDDASRRPTDDRLKCAVWDKNTPKVFDTDSYACVKDPKCTKTCELDPKATKHLMFKCANQELCTSQSPLTKPGSEADGWTWKAVAPADLVDAANSVLKYKVVEAKASTKTTAPCKPFAKLVKNKDRIALTEAAWKTANAGATFETAVEPLAYLCHGGRAYKCKTGKEADCLPADKEWTVDAAKPTAPVWA